MSEQKNIKVNPGQSRLFAVVIAVVVIGFCGYSFLTGDLKHIEDTNGPDNCALAVITDENIINQDVGALNVNKSTGFLSDGITFSSKKFTGVYRVFLTNFLFDSDFQMDLTNFYVNSGNFRMCIVNEGRIICEVEPGEMFTEVLLHDLNGSFELIIAGESADFEFSLDRLFCEQYGIEIGG